MKTIKPFVIALTSILMSLSFYSCLDDDKYYPWPENSYFGIVTLKPLGENSYYLQLDDSTTFMPSNEYVPYFSVKEEQRVKVVFKPDKENAEGYNYTGNIFYMDSILTKPIAENLAEKNDEVYGKDPVEMWKIWIEDGYLTFQFSTYFGNTQVHYVNLIQPDEANAPYELEFRHNAYNDPSIMKAWGLVSFKLDKLPDTGGKSVKLKIKCNSFTGEKVYELDYCTKQPAGEKASLTNIDNFERLQ